MADMTDETLTAIGLMSGTSMDGIDAALLQTDGERIAGFGPSLCIPYEPMFRNRLRAVVGRDPAEASEADTEVGGVAEDLTGYHVEAVRRLISENGLDAATIDVIGFHGHTIFHDPEHGVTRQIGNGERLAGETGLPWFAISAPTTSPTADRGHPLRRSTMRLCRGIMKNPWAF